MNPSKFQQRHYEAIDTILREAQKTKDVDTLLCAIATIRELLGQEIAAAKGTAKHASRLFRQDH